MCMPWLPFTRLPFSLIRYNLVSLVSQVMFSVSVLLLCSSSDGMFSVRIVIILDMGGAFSVTLVQILALIFGAGDRLSEKNSW